MAIFIEIPTGSDTPILLNVEDIQKVRLYDGPSQGGSEIKVLITERHPKYPILHEVKFKSSEDAKTYYKELGKTLKASRQK